MLLIFVIVLFKIIFIKSIQIIDYFPQELMLKYQVLIKELGDTKSEKPKQQQFVLIHYEGYFADTNQVFDSSQQIPQILQIGEQIQCWNDILPYMHLNMKIKIFCPFESAFGQDGAKINKKYQGIDIPPNTDLGFDLHLVKIYNDNPDNEVYEL